MNEQRTGDTELLAALADAASAAQREEIAFRKNVDLEIEKRTRARQYAFRRLSIAEIMLAEARRAGDEDKAIAAQTAALRAEFGWYGEGEAHTRIIAAWRPVALAVWEAVRPNPESGEAVPASPSPDIAAALVAFEHWYEAAFGTSYLAILDVEKQEYPVVEF